MSAAALMRRALELARRGRGRVEPNPMVGCVIARGSRVVGEGWHARYGGPHAEIRALRAAGRAARGADVYVSLEPCCHHGKTPPCAEALLRAGVRRVFAAMRDPDPRVSGRGLALLAAAGVRTSCGLLGGEARRLNRGFARWVRRPRPYVILKAAASLDGRIETSSGESKWITSRQARALGRRMRSETDAVLVGVGTALADDPRLTAPGARSPLRVVLDARLRTPRGGRLMRGGPTLIVTAALPPRGLPPSVSLLRVPRRAGGLDLEAALAGLRERGVRSLIVEGGSRVHTSFLEAGLVDEVRLFLAPRLIGGGRARGFFEGRGARRLADALELRELRVRRVGPDILISGSLEAR